MIKKNYKVAILMSTYNGEKYISKQIESILNQKNIDLKLYIRDDGSSDDTVNIINRYKKKYKNIWLIEGENIGFANSFYELIKNNYIADYYAFSDQDDIWEDNKIISAIETFKNEDSQLYASNLKIFQDNKVVGLLYKQIEECNTENNLKNYFYIYNPYGCTMVWNASLQKKLKEYPKPDKLTHDVWVNLIAHSCGKFYYDSNAYIKYRIHANNACGLTPQGLNGKIKKYFKFYFIDKKSLNISLSCNYIIHYFDKCSNKYIKGFSNYKKNLINRILAMKDICTLNVMTYDKFKFILLMLFNKF